MPLARPAEAGIGLRTHIAEIVGLIDRHELADVILVGHSYGGMVITGAGQERPPQPPHGGANANCRVVRFVR
ncbi:alpha/beta hydrolase [Streptomyces sp. NPDC085944]|uniref:alpha/beta fold hydrolase n=1 Tax=Streptomyces sp. NPDC085944 TaxID=3154962 RepID=UPI00343CA52E